MILEVGQPRPLLARTRLNAPLDRAIHRLAAPLCVLSFVLVGFRTSCAADDAENAARAVQFVNSDGGDAVRRCNGEHVQGFCTADDARLGSNRDKTRNIDLASFLRKTNLRPPFQFFVLLPSSML